MPREKFPCLGMNDKRNLSSDSPDSISERFGSLSSDITFRSCDGTLFKVHRKNLETHADGFPPAELTSPLINEVSDLSETATTLELLFQYMYPQRQPDLTKEPFCNLANLSEAAEKYQVFSALEICKFHMRATLPKHPLQVLNYAVKHGYRDIADEAAPATIPIPMKDIANGLSPAFLGVWIQYYEKWVDALGDSCTESWSISHRTCRAGPNCEAWLIAQRDAIYCLGSKPGSLLDLDAVFGEITSCCCNESIEAWRRSVMKRVAEIPKFSKFW